MQTLSTKVPAELMDRVDSYAEEIGETRSVAVRHLLRAGLDAETEPARVPIVWLPIYLGSIAFTAAFVDTTPDVGLAGAAVVAATIVLTRPTVQTFLAKVRDALTAEPA